MDETGFKAKHFSKFMSSSFVKLETRTNSYHKSLLIFNNNLFWKEENIENLCFSYGADILTAY